ncbi:MAG: HD domain-containing phosphohydrolase, partial [Dehalococcoidia bacterium]
GLTEQEVEELSFGAVLHDVGKLRIPDAILLKPGRLNDEEWSVVHRHPLYGEGILTRSKIPKVALHVARWHHERWDGRGYPDGLSGNEIPAAAQIVTVADVFDALTSTRPYKPAWPAAQALDEIRDHREHQFSPQVVDAFEALWEEGVIQSILASQTDGAREHPANGIKAA